MKTKLSDHDKDMMELVRRIQRGWSKTHPVTEEELKRIRQIIRTDWERKQAKRSASKKQVATAVAGTSSSKATATGKARTRKQHSRASGGSGTTWAHKEGKQGTILEEQIGAGLPDYTVTEADLQEHFSKSGVISSVFPTPESHQQKVAASGDEKQAPHPIQPPKKQKNSGGAGRKSEDRK